jgi:hypothetical protein
MSRSKVRFMNPPADTLWFYFNTRETLRAWVDSLKSINTPSLVSLPSNEAEGVQFYMIQGRVLGLIVDPEAAKQ